MSEKDIPARFDSINRRFNSLDEKFSALEGRLTSLENKIDQWLEEEHSAWEKVLAKLNAIEGRFHGVTRVSNKPRIPVV